MSLLCYCEPINRLPTPEEAGLSASTTQAVNQAVEKAVSVNHVVGVANTQHVQITFFKFAIYLEEPETQLFYYAI